MNELVDFRLPSFDEALDRLPLAAPDGGGADEAFWRAVGGLYSRSEALANLENGYWGAMAEPVKAMFRHWTDRTNFETTLLIREHWPDALEALRCDVAGTLGCRPDEIVLTRGATEAMLALISGYNRLAPGDAVLYCDLDYPAMRNAMQWLRERRQVEPVAFSIPEPATRESVLAAYAEMLRRHPKIRLVLLTHLSHCTGLVMPVRELAAMARAAGAEVIVDAAHSWGQIDFDVGSLNAPYAAFNLHKWTGAPLGCGCMYIRADRLSDIDPYFGDRDHPADDIRSRIHTGSPNFAAWLTIPSALQLHRRITARAKEARLRHLRDHWVQRARALPGIEILTPDDPTMVAGITAFRITGRTSTADNDAIVAALRDSHGVCTVRRSGLARGDVVRVTPAITTTHAELDRLVAGLAEVVA
jgi:selenocysteine lyase/cysteine desulfurase